MSKQINFNVEQQLEMIEYPGLVKNTDNMLKTLGGINSISKVLAGETKRLELKFHRDNPFNKTICSNNNAEERCGLLLKVKIRRPKVPNDKPPEYTVEIIGHCIRVFRFDGLCDFQYLPLEKHESPRYSFNIHPIMPSSVVDIDFFTKTEYPLLALPTIFARSDVVHTRIYRRDQKENGQYEVLGVLQKSSIDNRDVINFNLTDSFPTKPNQEIIKRMRIKYISDEQFVKVKKLFDDCPIWTRIALLYESDIPNDKLKCILPSLAYYFTAGPWRTLYVRYGYDPRKDHTSRNYQTFDFRLRFRTGISEFVAVKRQSLLKKRALMQQILHQQQQQQHQNDDDDDDAEQQDEQNTLIQDVDYPYLEEDKLPRSRQCILRYCDIRIGEIQTMFEKLPTPLPGANCNERLGWLPANFDNQVRLIVNNSIKECLRNYYRKEAIKAEEENVSEDEVDDNEQHDQIAEEVIEYMEEDEDIQLDDEHAVEEILSQSLGDILQGIDDDTPTTSSGIR